MPSCAFYARTVPVPQTTSRRWPTRLRSRRTPHRLRYDRCAHTFFSAILAHLGEFRGAMTPEVKRDWVPENRLPCDETEAAAVEGARRILAHHKKGVGWYTADVPCAGGTVTWLTNCFGIRGFERVDVVPGPSRISADDYKQDGANSNKPAIRFAYIF